MAEVLGGEDKGGGWAVGGGAEGFEGEEAEGGFDEEEEGFGCVGANEIDVCYGIYFGDDDGVDDGQIALVGISVVCDGG